MIRAACYERVSTWEQAVHGYSVESQITALEEYCRKQGFKLVGHYTDDGISGGKESDKRPEMSRLLRDVAEDKIDIILITKIDRWFRNVPAYYRTQDILEKHHCNWKTILEEYDSSTANGKFLINVMLSSAEMERNRTAERINFVFHNKHKNGEYTCSSAPHGYAIEIRDGKRYLIKNPETQEAFEAFFKTLVETKCHAEARRVLMDHGVYLTKKVVSEIIREGKWYTGEHDGNPNYCPAYITKQQLASIQKGKVKKAQHNRYYLFTGLIHCECCGKIMYSTYKSYSDKSKEYYMYRCRGKNETCKNNATLSEGRIEKQLMEILDSKLQEYIIDVEAKQIARKQKAPSRVPALKEKLRRVNESYFAGNIDDDEYKQLADSIKQQIKDAEPTHDEPEVDLVKLKSFSFESYRDIYMTLTKQEKQIFWRNLISEIVVHGHTVVDIKFRTEIGV